MALALAVGAATPVRAEDTRFVTEDVPRFWRAFDRIEPDTTDDEAYLILDDAYFSKASPGLASFMEARPQVRRRFAPTLRTHRRYYASIRESTLAITTKLPAIRAALARMRRLYPPARFPPVYFVIGVLGTGGTSTGAGLLIGAEHWSRTPASPVDELTAWEKDGTATADQLPRVVVHELIHHLQRASGKEHQTLLENALGEGMASFLAELVTGQRESGALYPYGDAHERALWAEFSRAMDGTDTSHWLYEGDAHEAARPADLGYYIGYRICAAAYGRAPDKKRAIAAMLAETDAKAFLAASGYARDMTAR